MVWKPNDQLQAGKYIIEKLIYSGGFGLTYLARNPNNQKFVIKTFNEKKHQPSEWAKCQQDLMNEALFLAKCSHPHIVKVEEFILEESRWCTVLEYIDGVNLGDRIKNEVPLSEAEALHYIQQIADAINWVHRQGLLHRDVKPLNIIVKKQTNDAILIDFGNARKFIQNLTQVHTEYVSKGFAPIEQYDRRSQRGTYTDVYGLAATLYALVTGQTPEAATLRDRSVNKYKTDSLVLPQEINPKISDKTQTAILKGMAIEPEDRPQTVFEWLQLLELNLSVSHLENSSASLPLKSGDIHPPLSSANSQWRSAVGINYSSLQALLKEQNWQAADQETADLMLQVLGKQKTDKLTIEDLKNFPCRDLRILDQLWLESSQNRFGFSVQNRIWQSVQENYEKFGNVVGWCQGNLWFPYAEMTFNLSAPEGHLPTWGRRGKLWASLAQKLKKCGL